MGDICGILGIFLIGLSIVTLVGHLIWITIAAILRSISGDRRQPRSAPANLDEAAVTLKKIEELYRDALIDHETFQKLLQAMHRQHPGASLRPRNLRGARPAPIPRPAPPPIREPVAEADVPAMEPPPIPQPPPLPELPAFAQVAEAAGHGFSSAFIAPPRLTAPPPRPKAIKRPPPPPPPPRKPFSEILKHFMEESNIRWGELVGGLLIIGCSIALVLTFWDAIATQPWLRFFLFTAVTSAVFAAGLYTEHRWKLPTTSRGLLLIATLMIPLNFLASSRIGGSTAAIAIAQDLFGLALFGFLSWLAAKVLAERWPIALVIGVLGPSIVQSLTARLITTTEPASSVVLLLALLAVAFYVAANGLMFASARKIGEFDSSAANQTLLLLATSTFAVLLPLGVLAVRAQDWLWTAQQISPVLSLAAMPMLAVGLLLWRRLKHPDLAAVQTIGLAIAALAGFILLGGIVIAWPDPARMIAAATLAFAIVTSIAIYFEIPAAHLLALPCLALVYILTFHLLLPATHPHHITLSPPPHQLARAMLSPTAGSSLLGLVLLLSMAIDWLKGRQRPEARFYFVAAAALAVISLGLISIHGLGRRIDHGATWIFSGYALMAGWLAWRSRRSEGTWTAVVLLAVALVQALVFRFGGSAAPIERWTLAALIHASLVILVTASISRLKRPEHQLPFLYPLVSGALITTTAAVAFIVTRIFFAAELPPLQVLALQSLWSAVLILGISIIIVGPRLFAAFQVLLAGSAVLFAISLLQSRPWFAAAPYPFMHPWTLQAAAIAVAVLSLAWTALRLGLRRADLSPTGTASHLLSPEFPSIDRIFPYIALGIFVLMAFIAAAPAVAHELAAAGQITVPSSISPAAGWGSWLLLAVVSAAITASLWVRFRAHAILAILVAVVGGCALAAASFDPHNSAASALRWFLAALLLIGSLPIWFRKSLNQLPAKLHWPHSRFELTQLKNQFRPLLLILTVIPILAITFYSAARTFTGIGIAGPIDGSFFHRIGSSLSYLAPLIVTLIVFIGHAYRDRSPTFAFAGAMMLNITVTLAYTLWLVTAGESFETAQLIHLAQFNAIASAIYALGWMFIMRRQFIALYGPAAPTRPGALLLAQVAIPIILLLCLLLPCIVLLFLNPSGVTASVREVAGIWGWIGWALVAAVVSLLSWMSDRRLRAGSLCAALLIAGSMLTLRFVGGTEASNWLAYHALLTSTAFSAWLMLGLGAFLLWKERAADEEEASGSAIRFEITRWTVILGSLLLILSMRCIWDDPSRPWWGVCGLLALSPLAIALAFWTMRSAWLYPAGLLLNLAFSIAWIFGRHPVMPSPFLGLIQLNIIILAMVGAAFLVLELRILRPIRSQVVHVGIPAFHHFAAIGALICIFVITLLSVAAQIIGTTAASNPLLTWAAPGAVLVLMIATLWDRDARYALFGLYLMGLIAAATVLRELKLPFDDLVWVSVIVAAAYSVLVGYLYTQRSSFAKAAESAGVPLRQSWPVRTPGWVGILTMVQSVFVFILAFFAVQFLPGQIQKLCVAAGAFSMAVAVGLLALEEHEARLKRAALLLGLFGAILWGWAWLPRFGPDLFLNRVVIVMIAMAGGTIFYAIGLVKLLRRETQWTMAAKRLVPLMGAGTVISLVLVLIAEALMYRPNLGAPMALWAFIAVALALLALAAAAMVCAIVPGKDPFNLSERGRQIYVYATELLLVLLFVHTKLVYPDLLNIGIWTRFWPIIVMLLAFLGIGLSEMFRRQGRPVLAEPLEKTSLLLPFLPVLAFFALGNVWKHQENVNYALVLLLAGAAYGALAVLRRSFVFGLMSALAGNAALWHLLAQSTSFGFFQHPQLWLIPVSLSILAAAYMNQARLSAEQMRTIRYLCLMTIYASSTADIMINGISRAPALPIMLAALSVAGVMAGIMLRVQSFLFLGTLFLLVSIGTMIQYAAHRVGQNWPWLVAGIILGSGIIVIFALFEKKRAEMLSLVDGLKEWQR